jgi:gluconolactonase
MSKNIARLVAQEGFDRRTFFKSCGAASVAAFVPKASTAERDWTGNTPVRYPDPDIISLDPRFDRYRIVNTTIERLHTGALWAEGVAWNGVGRYLIWSDIPNDRQMRWLEEDGHISVFRTPAGNSNGNTFDREGRQISCEHGNRRVARYEFDGSVTVLAAEWEGKPFNAPNDLAVHHDGGVWFTDPGYGSMGNYEGHKGELHHKEAVYRIDPKTGKVEKVAEDNFKPNGICFSPDYMKLYIADTGGPTPKGIKVYDVVEGLKLKNPRKFVSMEYDGRTTGLADGLRADVDGNIWASAGWGGPGYDGVHIFTPGGERIGMIRLPEACSNVCFGGLKRNRLFMTASRSVYSVYVETRGAHRT